MKKNCRQKSGNNPPFKKRHENVIIFSTTIMAAVEEYISRVNHKLQQLLKQYQFLQKENEKLQLTVTKLQSAREQEMEKINQLEQQVSILKSSVEQMNEPDKKVFEKQINQYIKEIDKCIGLLSE